MATFTEDKGVQTNMANFTDDKGVQTDSKIDTDVKIGAWKGSDPREWDWHCSSCDVFYYDGGTVCERCHAPRVYDRKEQEQIEDSENSGQRLSKRVYFAKAAVSMHEIEERSSSLRWWKAPQCYVQLWQIHGRVYALVAVSPVNIPGSDKILSPQEEEAMCLVFQACKPYYTIYNYATPRSLNSISADILHKRYPHVGDYYQIKEKPVPLDFDSDWFRLMIKDD